MQLVGLAGCGLGADEAKAVADYVSVSASLTSLDIRWNELGPEGAKAISESLHVNASLTKLDVRYNNIDDGAAFLREAVKGCGGFSLCV